MMKIAVMFLLDFFTNNPIVNFLLTPLYPLIDFFVSLLSINLRPFNLDFSQRCGPHGQLMPHGDGAAWLSVGVLAVLLIAKFFFGKPKQLIPTIVVWYIAFLLAFAATIVLEGPRPLCP